MEKPDLEFYRQRRLEKTKKRQANQFKKIGVIAGLALLALIVIASFFSKPAIVKNSLAVAKIAKSHHKQKIVMAQNGNLKLYLPIAKNSVTAIGYHEAFNPQSVQLAPRGIEKNTKKMSRQKFLELKTKYEELIYSLMWRGFRGGPINSSVDVGAKAGTLTYAPISGRVAQIRKYKLYGRIPDNEVHILPEGYNDRHLVIIHINDLKVRAGDRVATGITPIGRVRQLSHFFKQQLSDYSKEAGDHAHYQINKLVNGKCHRE